VRCSFAHEVEPTPASFPLPAMCLRLCKAATFLLATIKGAAERSSERSAEHTRESLVITQTRLEIPPPNDQIWTACAQKLNTELFVPKGTPIGTGSAEEHTQATIFDWTSRYAKFRNTAGTEEDKPTIDHVLQQFQNPTDPGGGSGISGASFFLSEDKTFIAKSLDDREVAKAMQLAETLQAKVTGPSLLVPVWFFFRLCQQSACRAWIISPTILGERAGQPGKFDVKAFGTNTISIGSLTIPLNTMTGEDDNLMHAFPSGFILQSDTFKELQDRFWQAKLALDDIEVYDYSLMIVLSEQENGAGMRGPLVMDNVKASQSYFAWFAPEEWAQQHENGRPPSFKGSVAIGIIDQYSNWGQAVFEATGQAAGNSQAYSKNMIARVAGMVPVDPADSSKGWRTGNATLNEVPPYFERYFHLQARRGQLM